MDDERSMVIHYMDGSQTKLSFPKQVRSDDTVPGAALIRARRSASTGR